MIEKDILMNLIYVFFKALNDIANNIKNGELKNLHKEISTTYTLLGNSSKFFIEEDINIIMEFFKDKNGDHLKRVNMLIELMYLDSKIKTEESIKTKLVSKNIKLLEYYLLHSNEYSYKLNSLLIEMKNCNN